MMKLKNYLRVSQNIISVLFDNIVNAEPFLEYCTLKNQHNA